MRAAIEELIDRSWAEACARTDLRSGAAITRPALEPLAAPRSESVFSDRFPVLEYLDAGARRTPRGVGGSLRGSTRRFALDPERRL